MKDAPGPELALETSRREASVALAAGTETLADELGAEVHARDLVPRIQRLLERDGSPRREGKLVLGAVYVGLGPGSYTGLRVGIATAIALARSCGAPLYGVPSFEALAFAALEVGSEGTVAMDARSGRFYHARYRRTASGLAVLDAPAVLDARELAARCARAGVVLGHPGLDSAAGLALAQGTALRTDARPEAKALLALGRARRSAGELAPSATLEPLYLTGFGRAGFGRTGLGPQPS